jgi:hypothetical protein
MKNFKYLFLVIGTIFVFEMVSFNKAEAACTVTADGIKKASSSADDSIEEGCDTVPDLYEIVIYKLYLCTSAPTVPTTSSTVVLTPCSQIFNNDSGATASVSSGKDIDIDGTFTRPPDGTYTHGYAYMDDTFGITWSGKISASMEGGTGGTSGVHCASVTGSGTHRKGSTHTNNSICGSSPITAGKFVETLNQFGGATDDFTATAEVENINGTTAKINGYLVDTSEQLATDTDEVVKLEGLVTFANPVIITPDTTSISIRFNVDVGMHVYRNSSSKFMLGGGPFQAIMTAN